MSEILTQKIVVDTAGGAGAAVGSEDSMIVQGFLLDVFIDYDAGAPATTDVTIRDAIFGAILTRSNSATKGWFTPRKQSCDQSAADTGAYELIPVNGILTIDVAQCDAITAAVSVTLRIVSP
jgi:hypothetical protein